MSVCCSARCSHRRNRFIATFPPSAVVPVVLPIGRENWTSASQYPIAMDQVADAIGVGSLAPPFVRSLSVLPSKSAEARNFIQRANHNRLASVTAQTLVEGNTVTIISRR